MLDRLTLSDFTPLVGSAFRVVLPESPVSELTLVDAVDLGSKTAAPSSRRAAFSLHFIGNGPVLTQRIYPLESDALGRLEIFLVPVGKTDAGVQYEAIFN